MSATAVPLRPIARGSVLKLWIALLLLAAAAVALAWYGTAGQIWTKTASGLRYQVIKEGTGPQPTATDYAVVDYVGMLADGTVFDSSRGQPRPFPVAPGATIKGFSEGLQLMHKGGVYRLRIPPQLGYGAAGSPPAIPPNSTLIFEVNLVEVLSQEQVRAIMMQQQLQQQMQGQGQGQGQGPPPGAAGQAPGAAQ